MFFNKVLVNKLRNAGLANVDIRQTLNKTTLEVISNWRFVSQFTLAIVSPTLVLFVTLLLVFKFNAIAYAKIVFDHGVISGFIMASVLTLVLLLLLGKKYNTIIEARIDKIAETIRDRSNNVY